MLDNTILIIDDNENNLELLEYVLTYHKYQVRAALNASEALKILADFKPALILMDLQMPGINGFELIKMLREMPEFKHTKIVAVTAYAMQADEEKVKMAGFQGYITKPIDVKGLPDIIAKYMKSDFIPG